MQAGRKEMGSLLAGGLAVPVNWNPKLLSCFNKSLDVIRSNVSFTTKVVYPSKHLRCAVNPVVFYWISISIWIDE